MATKLHPLIPLIFSLIITLKCFFSPTKADDDACPYPCIPPPIAGTVTPPSPPSQTEPYSYPPPAGNFPNYPPSSGGNFPNYPPSGGGFGDMMPPPPDPILPYFPYYYRNGLHRSSDQSSSSNRVSGSTLGIVFAVASVCYVVLASPMF